MPTCNTCFRKCEIAEGATGYCGARTCRNGCVTAANYGEITALALDPIEKKPLQRFHPGSMILSVGSYGCNLRCPFCQNHEISWSAHALRLAGCTKLCSPKELVALALDLRRRGNIGIAFTYNEPLVGWEYVRDAAAVAHKSGLATALVTNGTAGLHVLKELAPHIDAMNIDLKGFSARYYRDVLGGDLEMVKDFIREAVRCCHVELTTLIVPGENDTDEEMRSLCRWVAGLEPAAPKPGEAGGAETGGAAGRSIPLHISRFFPRFHMTDRKPTEVRRIFELAAVAEEYLDYVYPGNV